MRNANIPLYNNFILEDMAFPGALAEAVNWLLAAGGAIAENTDPNSKAAQTLRTLESIAKGPYFGASHNTLLVGGMAHDNQQGVMSLIQNRLCFSWPTSIDPVQNALYNTALKQACANLQGLFIKNILADPLVPGFPANLVRPCVHPLGGCIMADNAAQGVVNDRGQVYSCASGTATYSNLYVADGSIVPTSVGVNPLFTISALAERQMALMIADKGWAIGASASAAPSAPPVVNLSKRLILPSW
jgi:cholesterol oxidase